MTDFQVGDRVELTGFIVVSPSIWCKPGNRGWVIAVEIEPVESWPQTLTVKLDRGYTIERNAGYFKIVSLVEAIADMDSVEP